MLAPMLALLAQATPPPAPVSPGTAEARAADVGADVYERKCVFCHGADGRGQTKKGRQLRSPDFSSPKWQRETPDSRILEAIEEGRPKGKMPAYKDKLSPEELRAVAAYIRSFARPIR